MVLIDELTASASDNLVTALHDHRPEIVFVGRPTAGTSGAPRDVELPNSRAHVSFATMRVYGPSDTLIEGRGVTPNVKREWRRADIIHNIDVDLAAALDLLGWRPAR